MREFVSVVPASGDLPAGLATLLLTRPPTNALTRQMYRELTEAVAELERREDVRAVVVSGGHEIFSAGDDMSELQTLNAGEAAVAAEVADRAVAALTALSKPTVAAVTGYALGAGMTLALAADWRVSGDNVRFGATEILAGRTPAHSSSRRLAAAIGHSRAKDLVFSGRFVDAREALALGLVDDLVSPDAVYDAAVAWAARLLDHPQPVLAAAKAAFASDDVLAGGDATTGR